MEEPRRVLDLGDLGAGDHLCCIYGTEEEHRAVIAPFLRRGLERGEKVLYIVDARTAGDILGYLRDEGVEVDACLESGQLVVLSVDDSYMREGEFDPDGMIRLLEDETRLALSQGYSALRVTGEMTWALRGLPGSERLIEYEAKLNRFFPGSACLAVCQYDRRRFGPGILLGVLTTHPIAVIGTEIYDNFYYISPEDYLGDNLPAAAMERRISQLEERRKMEESLRESEGKFRSVVEQSADGIMLADGEGVIREWNRAQEEITGIKRGEALGRSVWDVRYDLEPEGNKSPAGYERLKAGIVDYLETSRSASWMGEPSEWEITRADGRRRAVQVVTFPIHAPQGAMLGIISRDVTDRRRVEEALRRSEEKYRRIVDSAQEGIWAVDERAATTFVNQRMADMLGYSVEEMVGAPLFDFMREDMRELARENMQRRREGISETFEFRLLRRDGSELHVSMSASPIIDEKGAFAGLLALVSDISERKRAEEALAREVEINRALADLSRMLLAGESIEDIACQVLEDAKRLTGSPFGYAGYIDVDTGYLITPTFTRDIWEECDIASKSTVFKEFTGLWGWVLKNHEPLIANAPREDPRSSGTPPGHVPIERFISVPALMGEALVGQIALANAGRDYDGRDLALLQRLADVYAVAVLRMWSEGELERYRDHLEELVMERTLDLERANRQLQEEIAERVRQEKELVETARQLRALSARLQSVREEERRRISRDVHDNLGQALTGLKMQLALLGKKIPPEAGLGESLEEILGHIDAAIQSVRDICAELRPGLLDDLGLAAALEWQLQQFEEMTGITCSFSYDVDDGALDREANVALFRISQEALTNVARHADAGAVEVRLAREGDELVLEIADDGRGFREEEGGEHGSLGLLGMKERAYALGGKVFVSSEAGRGTRLTTRIPMRERGEGGRGREP